MSKHKYETVSSLPRSGSQNTTLLHCISFNSSSIVKSGACDALHSYCLTLDLALVCISETHATDTLTSAELSFGGRYAVFRKDRLDRRGGGVCILVRKDIQCNEIVSSVNSEIVAIDIFCGSPQLHRLICAYFSPTGSSPELTVRMRNLCADLDFLLSCDNPVTLVGDFNQPNINWDGPVVGGEASKEYIFHSFCVSSGLTQLVTSNTRPQSGNILDLVLTNDEELVLNVRTTSAPVESDHLAVHFDIIGPSTESVGSCFKDFAKADFQSISTNLSLIDWRQMFVRLNTVDDFYIVFVDYLSFLLSLFVPMKRDSNSSLESFIIRATEKVSSDPNSSRLSKALKKASRRLRLHAESQLDIKDAKSFFRYANRRLNMRSGVSPLQHSGGTAVEDCEKADVLLKYFESVYLAPMRLLPTFTMQSIKILNDVSFSYAVVQMKLFSLAPKLNLTPDGLPPIVFKRLCDLLATPLSLIFERSFEDGEVPHFFRKSIVTPVFKKGPRSMAENYRPVAQLVVPCLVMESIIVDEITNFLISEKLLDPNQHGFTKGKSTASQLLEVVYDWSIAINHRHPLHCIYFDFSKAFDCVDHNLLLLKMESLGIGPRIIAWCRSYLRVRTFQVKVGHHLSESRRCSSGVPQGSCLGPLMFSIFAQDLQFLFTNSVIKHKVYADDLKLYCEIRSPEDCALLQQAINDVSMWAKKNGLAISVPKCAVLMTDSTSAQTYVLDDAPLPVVSYYKDLGVVFDSQLKFRHHITSIAKSASKLCSLILRAFIICNPEVYLKAYKALVVPKWMYCSHVWHPYYKMDTNLLQVVQDKFVERVARRCNISASLVHLPSVATFQHQVDLRVFRYVVLAGDTDKYFDIRHNNLRSTITVCAKEVAHFDSVNSSFPWRFCRKVNSDSTVLDYVSTLCK